MQQYMGLRFTTLDRFGTELRYIMVEVDSKWRPDVCCEHSVHSLRPTIPIVPPIALLSVLFVLR
jgi:hypothetical protein